MPRPQGPSPAGFARLLAALPIAAILRVLVYINPLKLFRRRPPPPPIIRPYVNSRRPLRRVGRAVFPVLLILFCLIYGFFFALTAPYLLLPFCAPVVILVLLSIWALPDTAHIPTKAVEFGFMAVIVSRILWPNYLALELPGLPWITLLQLFGFPMAFLLLICLSTSHKFRTEVSEALGAIPGLRLCLVGLTIMGFVTLPLSKQVGASLQIALLGVIYMLGMAAIGAWLARTPGRVTRYVFLLLLLSIPIMVITIAEARVQQILWVGHIPAFMKVDDPAVVRTLSSATRGATGLYRAKATFSTSLGLAEYLAILTPFLIHIAVSKYNMLLRVVCVAAMPVFFYCIRATDARLGVVGYGVSFLLYGLLWGLSRFMRKRTDLIGAAVVYGYPAVFLAAGAAVLSIHRLRVLVFGGGAQASSNAARQQQIVMGLPKILSNPIGHGMGQAGNSLGYAADDFVTVDNYYLTITLENGVAGLLLFLGMFISTIVSCTLLLLRQPKMMEDKELSLIIPMAVSFSAFLVIKGVFSQTDSHMLLFAMLGMTAGLAYRIKLGAAKLAEEAAAAAPPSATAAQASKPATRPIPPRPRLAPRPVPAPAARRR